MAEKKRQPRRSKAQIIDDTIAKIDAETAKLKTKIAKNDDAKALLLKGNTAQLRWSADE